MKKLYEHLNGVVGPMDGFGEGSKDAGLFGGLIWLVNVLAQGPTAVLENLAKRIQDKLVGLVWETIYPYLGPLAKIAGGILLGVIVVGVLVGVLIAWITGKLTGAMNTPTSGTCRVDSEPRA